jgi:hypothetical protein
MKKSLISLFAAATLMLALFLSGTLSAQTNKTENGQKTEGYKFEKGQEIHRDYVDKILKKKMRLLEQYLTALIKKEDPNYIQAIDKAMLLFNNDESKLVTITSKTTGKVYVKTIKEYLHDISVLPYKSVDVTYRNYTAIENIRKQPDGTFRGIVVFEQEFKGYNQEGVALYGDVIERNMEVILRIREYPKDEKSHIVSMDVFFGNLGVTEM